MIQVTTPLSLKSETDDKAADYLVEVVRDASIKLSIILSAMLMVQVTTPVSLKSDTEEKPDTPKDLQMKVVDT